MKKRTKKLSLAGLTAAGLLLLSGYMQSHVVHGVRVPTEHGEAGFTYRFIATPMIKFVELFAHNLHLGYGLAIILVTLIIRLLILPLGLNQAYKATYMQEKMAYLQPIFAPINERLKAATSPEEKMAAQQALMKAQKDNGINMFSSIGCLPIIIQYPFFIALYNAAMFTPGIMKTSFMGIPLAHPSIILVIISGVFYFAQSLLTTVGMNEEQKKASRTMLIISPAMIVIMSFAAPAAAALYWAVGGFVMLIQQVIISFIMKPNMKKRIDREFTENPPKTVDLPKDVTPTSTENPASTLKQQFDAITTSEPARPKKSGNGRNAGKQQRRK